mmetsp:Transcript_13662/g.40304  ORF Transcript_13662/g.40304 Transcript_13662/m.40304 type:complete len:243 (-) Transcript_13662:123-851(-)
MDRYEAFAAMREWTRVKEELESEGVRPITPDRARMAEAIAAGRAEAEATGAAQDALFAEARAAAEARSAVTTQYITNPTAGHQRPPPRRTFTHTMQTKAKVAEMVETSFKGYSGSLASLNHTIGLPLSLWGGDDSGDSEYESAARPKHGAQTAAAEDLDSSDEDGGAAGPAIVVTASAPRIALAVDIERTARLSVGAQPAAGAGVHLASAHASSAQALPGGPQPSPGKKGMPRRPYRKSAKF